MARRQLFVPREFSCKKSARSRNARDYWKFSFFLRPKKSYWGPPETPRIITVVCRIEGCKGCPEMGTHGCRETPPLGQLHAWWGMFSQSGGRKWGRVVSSFCLLFIFPFIFFFVSWYLLPFFYMPFAYIFILMQYLHIVWFFNAFCSYLYCFHVVFFLFFLCLCFISLF